MGTTRPPRATDQSWRLSAVERLGRRGDVFTMRDSLAVLEILGVERFRKDGPVWERFAANSVRNPQSSFEFRGDAPIIGLLFATAPQKSALMMRMRYSDISSGGKGENRAQPLRCGRHLT
eukprot:scaffold7075_cov274-Pinguiococcus_pyrenoidosus.AAC.17